MLSNTRADITKWFQGLSDQWRATIRTTIQGVLGAVSIFLVTLMASLTNLLNGQEVDLVEDLSNASRLAGVALLGVASGFWAFIMNRHGGAKYGPPSGDPVSTTPPE